jgi:diaminohydroxyphosphoribosylaminopyrimidine deaminase/5-amino-6-(5-phosphoribosylamino)uracil reductase
MQRALQLAASHRTHPNPRVGAVVVDSTGVVVGEGAHSGPGNAHAEVVALEQAGDGARGATLYVTLEPCSHYGLTPPCVTTIVSSGVTRVVVGAIDPDERVSGSGASWLRDAGIEVVTGVLGDAVEEMDRSYFHQRRTGLPFVTLKLAMTLDGSVAAQDGSSQWITSEEARHDAHLLRAGMDAIVVGAGTLRVDDPLLTTRLAEWVEPQPRPVVVAGRSALPDGSRIWERAPIVLSARPIDIPSGELVVLEPAEGDWPDPVASARALADRGLYDVLIEGGPMLAGSWWRAGVVNRGVFYVGALVGGGRGLSPIEGDFATMAQSTGVGIREVRMVGPDIRIEFE